MTFPAVAVAGTGWGSRLSPLVSRRPEQVSGVKELCPASTCCALCCSVKIPRRQGFVSLGASQAYSHKVLLPALQQTAVCMDLLLQAAFDVQQDLVLLVLALHFCTQVCQLLLHACDLALQLSKVAVVATLCLSQRGFQVVPLRSDVWHDTNTGMRNTAFKLRVRTSKPNCEAAERYPSSPPTWLSCAWRSISRACNWRLSSVTWLLHVSTSCPLVITSRFTSSI